MTATPSEADENSDDQERPAPGATADPAPGELAEEEDLPDPEVEDNGISHG